ncbi:unnamed protein product [Urochloa decumbens]|uniref:DUF1618 domain-containing protein n=1 Tax=Urochloa decumbens TaxID=240449 RepID=A0ABC8XJE6_9POAL
MFGKGLVRLDEASFHPPAIDAGGDGDEAEIPCVLLEYNTYVADRRNGTTAVEKSSCGREIQVSFFAARPPRVSYLCVFCRSASTDENQEMMIAVEPKVLATDDNLLLLRIVVSPEKNLIDGCDFYIYQPAGSDGPSLQRLPRPPGNIILLPNHVGILSCPANDRDGGSTGLSLLRPHRAPQDKFYMVAALCDYNDLLALGRGRFVLHVYNSKLQTWTAINVSVDDQHFQKYQEEGYLLHFNTRAIAVGGEDATVAFVDLWNGILLCDLSHVKDKPWLRYVPLPAPSGSPSDADAYLSRDIAVVDGHFKFVQSRPKCKDCPTCGGDDYFWKFAIWTRPVSASSLLDDSWQLVCDMESSRMDVKSCPGFELLPKLGDNTSAPFRRLLISHPTLSWNCSTDNTVWFMVKVKQFDARAWVIAVDIMNNRLQGVAEFDAGRYTVTGFAYRHSRISKYLNKAPGTKEKLKRPGGMLLLGSAHKKLPGIRKPIQHDAGIEGVAEGGGDDMLLG